MKFAYQALDRNGAFVRNVIDARDRNDAIETLRRQGAFVHEIVEAGAAASAGLGAGATSRRARAGRGRRLKLVAMFARQLHVLVATGIPLTQALEALERQTKPGTWRDVLTDLRSHVEQGTPLSQAMGRHPGYFDGIVASMVESGEASGALSAMLDRLATLTRKQLHVRQSILGALIYPCLIVVVSLGVLVVMLTFVLPRFAELFKNLDTPLPAATKFLLALSHAMTAYWWAFIGGAVLVPLTIRAWLQSVGGARAIDSLALRLPKFGVLVRNFASARLVRTLGTLLQSKVQLLDALRLTKQGTANHHYVKLLTRAEQAMARGEPISAAFARGDLIPAHVYEALRNGERSGQVGPLLLNIAEFMDEENEVVLKSLTSIIEPLILIVLGVLVGAVATAMFMPLFDLTAATHA